MRHITQQQLNAYVDGALGEHEHREVGAHLESCDECRDALAELTSLVAELGGLPREGRPARDLWSGIAERTVERRLVTPIDRGRAAMRSAWSISLPQAAAAAVAAAIIAGSGVWLALGGGGAGPDFSLTPPPPATGAEFVLAPADMATYDDVVAELTRQLNARRAELDPTTVRVIRENIQIIDAAIGEINEALALDPSNEFLNAYLARAMRRKVAVLQSAMKLASRT